MFITAFCVLFLVTATMTKEKDSLPYGPGFSSLSIRTNKKPFTNLHYLQYNKIEVK